MKTPSMCCLAFIRIVNLRVGSDDFVNINLSFSNHFWSFMATNAKLAVLIDADNDDASVIQELLAEVSRYGTATIKRAYGNWTTPQLQHWKEVLNKLAIQPIQQFSYTTGKNSSDSALIIDAMDVLQNVFIKVWTSIENFRQEAQLSTWLYRISYNETMTFISKRKKENTFSFEKNEEAEKKNNNIKNTLKSDEYFDGDEIQLKLQTAIGLLPDKQKIVFTMRYYDEIKYEEMAEILQTSVGALKASYHHAVKKIEEYLKKD